MEKFRASWLESIGFDYKDISDTKEKARTFYVPYPEYGKGWPLEPASPLFSGAADQPFTHRGYFKSSQSFQVPFPTPIPFTRSRWPHIPHVSGTKRPGQQVGVPAYSGVTSCSALDTAPRTPLLEKLYRRQQRFSTCLYAFTTTSCPGSKVKEEKGWKIH